jgi:hypothetical protein
MPILDCHVYTVLPCTKSNLWEGNISLIYYVATTITIMYNTILVEKKDLNEKKVKVFKNDTTSSDKDLLYSFVDKAYYVDEIHHKIDNN